MNATVTEIQEMLANLNKKMEIRLAPVSLSVRSRGSDFLIGEKNIPASHFEGKDLNELEKVLAVYSSLYTNYQWFFSKFSEQKLCSIRFLDRHKIDGYKGFKPVAVLDGPGRGGASHTYYIAHDPDFIEATLISFQNGPLSETDGHNGSTHEQFLVCLIDRLEGFDSGDFANEHGRHACEMIDAGLEFLQERTIDRINRKVEGSYEK